MTRQCRLVPAVALLVLNVVPAAVCAQADDCRVGIIETVAGDGWTDDNGSGRYSGDGGLATQGSLNSPRSLAVGADGTIYIADGANRCVRRLKPAGVIDTIAGRGREACSRDGGPIAQAHVEWPSDVAVAPDGSVYIADQGNHRIARIDPDGVITTVAGTCGDGYSTSGYSGDGGPATEATLCSPRGVAVARDGSLYVADRSNNRIRRVDPGGIITTVAGNGRRGYSGDGGPATEASIGQLEHGIAVGEDGSLYIADTWNHRIRKVDPAGVITTVAGNGTRGYSGDGKPAGQASLDAPHGIAVGPDGSVYIADFGNHRVRRVDPAGIITTVAGSGIRGYSGDGGPATEASLNWPQGVALSADGSLCIADRNNHRVRKVDPAGIITTIAGDGWTGENGEGRHSGEGGPAIQASLDHPSDVALGPDGSVYIVDRSHRVRKVDRAGTIETIVASPLSHRCAQAGPATEADLDRVNGVAIAPDGSMYIADGANRIVKVDRRGVATTIAGTWCRNGHWSGRYSGDGGPATQASLNGPQGVAVGADGSLYIADMSNHRIRKIDPAGVITTVAGDGWQDDNGQGRYSADGGPATQASLNWPQGVAVAADGSLYIADNGNHRIRKVDPAGIITTVAGNGTAGYSGDGGPATQASLYGPAGGVALGADGSLYIADTYNNRIRKVDAAGIITAVAGNDERGCGGDGGAATEASLLEPHGVAIGPDGSLYIADSGNHRVRRVRWLPCEPAAARAAADELRGKAGNSATAWREVAAVYLIAKAWDDAVAAAERVLALTPETDETARMSAEVLVARVHAAKRDDHEARKRLIPILAQSEDSSVLREAADALVDLYLRRGERGQAIATLNDLRLRTKERGLLSWIDQRLKEIGGR